MDLPKLEEVKARCDEIRASLPEKVDAASLTLKSKIPYNAFTLRELCIHRISDLSEGAVSLFESNRLVPAVTLVRSVQETLAMLYSFHKKTEAFLQFPNVNEYHEFVSRCLVGSKQEPARVESINVLTHIGHFEKIVPGFRKMYDSLSEYAHPNWSGLLGSYGHTDMQQHITYFGNHQKAASIGVGLAALNGALIASAHYYNKLGGELSELNNYFEGVA